MNWFDWIPAFAGMTRIVSSTPEKERMDFCLRRNDLPEPGARQVDGGEGRCAETLGAGDEKQKWRGFPKSEGGII